MYNNTFRIPEELWDRSLHEATNTHRPCFYDPSPAMAVPCSTHACGFQNGVSALLTTCCMSTCPRGITYGEPTMSGVLLYPKDQRKNLQTTNHIFCGVRNGTPSHHTILQSTTMPRFFNLTQSSLRK